MEAKQELTPEVRKKAAELAFPAQTMIQQLAMKDCSKEAKAAAELLTNAIQNVICGNAPVAAN